MSRKKKNILYWLGQTVIGLASIAVQFAPLILGEFADHTVASKFAIPIGLGVKFIWDGWKYRRNTLPKSQTTMLDFVPNKLTGMKGSIKN